MTIYSYAKRCIAWFKLAEFVEKKEKEKALVLYRLLARSINNNAFVLHLLGTLHQSFNNYDEIIDEVSRVTFMPITVGGGIKTNYDIQKKLQIGADKVSINTESLLNPKFINEAAKEFGSQCIVASVDVKKIGGKYLVYNKKFDKELLVTEWVKKLEDLGAGEILLNSVDRDGQKTGYDIDLINKVCNIVNLPVIALGGAGRVEDFKDVLEKTDVDAVAAANFFQYIDQSVFLTRKYLFENNLNVRKPNLK